MSASPAGSRTKSPEAFRTISEVAAELDVPQHVLRFWESRFTQVRPVKRAGGRRYYRPEDVDLLRGIQKLLYGEGYTIKGVQKLLREHGPRFAVGIGRGAEMPADIAAAPVKPSPAKVSAQEAKPAASKRKDDDMPSLFSRIEITLPSHKASSDRAAPVPALTEDNREKLEILLAELLALKRRFRDAGRDV
jgi:DNA-binding transcriptional MerR regulator